MNRPAYVSYYEIDVNFMDNPNANRMAVTECKRKLAEGYIETFAVRKPDQYKYENIVDGSFMTRDDKIAMSGWRLISKIITYEL